MPKTSPSQLIDTAETLMKLHGYHGFSYADVAGRVGITKASIHHHFASKQDLAAETMSRYREAMRDALDRIAASDTTVSGRLRGFADVFLGAYHAEGRMCLCASLTGDWESLPEPIREQVAGYWNDTRAWLRASLWSEDATPSDRDREFRANAVISLFEGAMLCARADGDERPLLDAIDAAEVLVTLRG
ncbi:MAG: TetR/AcrR family transcriptional regulator [Planctomycetota bacterium]